MSLYNYECDGQLSISDYMAQKIVKREVKDLTDWINSQGKAQYTQIQEVVSKSYEDYKEDDDFLGRMTNAISIYVLNVSTGYMDYLRKECE